MKLLCCFDKRQQHVQKKKLQTSAEEDITAVYPDNYKTFGTIENIYEKYNITRLGKEQEVHTKHVDVPSPFKTNIVIQDELEPSRYIRIDFSGIHDSYYIGINEIHFKDPQGNHIPYQNIMVDGQEVDNEKVKPAFPPNGWWCVVDGDHSLVFDFGEVTHVKEIYFWCANAASTPKEMKITDGHFLPDYTGYKYDSELYFQLAGDVQDPMEMIFQGGLTFDEVIGMLNQDPPENQFKSFLSLDGKMQFVFYQRGSRTLALNYYFGGDNSCSQDVDMVNSTKPHKNTIDDVEYRALTLQELRGIRALILDKCLKEGWKSSRDNETILRPEDVNLYDLSKHLIKPLTEERNCSFKELFHSGHTKPMYYCSHWWGESVFDFISCIENHAQKNELDPQTATYWVCAHANRQHDLGVDLGNDPSQSSFNRAMQVAKGVLLVCDINAIVTSRIWVDFELYRTIVTSSKLDIVIHFNGMPHLIANDPLPNETPYQKNRRESNFPFQKVCRQLLSLELHKGESSMEIDKVRILNTMIEKRPLDSSNALERLFKNDTQCFKYQQDLHFYNLTNGALRAEMASKAVSIALSKEDQSLNNFHGFNLLDIISKDTTRTIIDLQDLASLDSVTDDVFAKLMGLATTPTLRKFVLNVVGCKNLTDACIDSISFPAFLKELDLNIGYAKNMSNEKLLDLPSKLPPSLETLKLNVCGYKTPDGNYLPPRYGSLMRELSKHISFSLKHFDFTTQINDSEEIESGVEGMYALLRELPSDLASLYVCVEQWDAFEGAMLVSMFELFPKNLKEVKIFLYSGDYVYDENMASIANCINTSMKQLSSLRIHTRSDARTGTYRVRNIHTVDEMKAFI